MLILIKILDFIKKRKSDKKSNSFYLIVYLLFLFRCFKHSFYSID